MEQQIGNNQSLDEKVLYLKIKEWSRREYPYQDILELRKDSKMNELVFLIQNLGYNSIEVLFDWKSVLNNTTQVWSLMDRIKEKTGIQDVYIPEIEYRPKYL